MQELKWMIMHNKYSCMILLSLTHMNIWWSLLQWTESKLFQNNKRKNSGKKKRTLWWKECRFCSNKQEITQKVACLQKDCSWGKPLYALFFLNIKLLFETPYHITILTAQLTFSFFASTHTLWLFRGDKGNIKLIINPLGNVSNQMKLKKNIWRH